MIDMKQIGLNICRLRKAAGMTQTELADKMEISFQAVSNWERGLSMPDISRLNELSQLFGVSVDEILNDNRMGEITEKLLRNQPIENVTLKDVEEVAPILHEKEVDTLFGYLVM